jgi:rare lipoprotein A
MMCSIGSDKSSGIGVRTGVRWLAVAVPGATLVACNQPAVVTDRSASLAAGRPAPVQARTAQPVRTASSAIHRRVAAKKHAPVARVAAVAASKRAAAAEEAAHGLASYYSYGTKTANGEKFDPGEMTAAHRTLPFGTRLRVTNTATGQSVTVRVNDRGPFIAGRVVDLSQSAAETLGIAKRGVAKVKLDVVQ